eukprot:423349-Alexandrium_andersonii.AAC.1
MHPLQPSWHCQPGHRPPSHPAPLPVGCCRGEPQRQCPPRPGAGAEPSGAQPWPGARTPAPVRT